MIFSRINNIKKTTIYLIFITLIIVGFKWIISYFFFPEEPLVIRSLMEIEDTFYLPYILNISGLDFNPNSTFYSYEDTILTMPIYSIMFHSFFFILFKHASFIIIELISFFIFLYLLFKIFETFGISQKVSLFLSLLIFFIPDAILILLDQSKIDFINLIIFQNIYNFRVPRPLITSLYFFSTLFVLILILKNSIKKYDNIYNISLGILLGLCFGSFYYNFVYLYFTFSLIFLYKFILERENFFYLLKNFFIVSLICLIVCSPYIILGIYSDIEVLERFGLLKLDFIQKKILVNYILSKFLNLKSLFILFFISFLFILIIYLKHEFSKKSLTAIYLLFISSILSPIIFIILSPSLNEVDHFINLTIIIWFLSLFIFSTIIFLVFLSVSMKNKKTKLIFNFLIVFIVILINIEYFVNFKKKNIETTEREDFLKLENFYKNNNEINSLLTFDINAQVWWLFKNKKLATIDSSLNSQKHLQNEISFIDAVKFLNISEDKFSKIISNQKTGWRYFNSYIRYFSWYKYQANSLTTYKNNQNYDLDVLNYIKNSNPTKSMQIIIPNDEKDRLINLFKSRNYSFENKLDMIILKKDTLIALNAEIDENFFCKLNDFKSFDVYIKKQLFNCKS